LGWNGFDPRIDSYMSASCTVTIRPLSEREQAVIEMLISGMTPKEVALSLGISRRTVSSYVYRVQIKTRQRTMLSAIAYVVANGLVMTNSA
jgi:DNA-binding CsgD family transcriptional regulator